MVQWKEAPPNGEAEATLDLVLTALGAPHVQAGITGLCLLILVLVAREVAERPYRRKRRLHSPDIMP